MSYYCYLFSEYFKDLQSEPKALELEYQAIVFLFVFFFLFLTLGLTFRDIHLSWEDRL